LDSLFHTKKATVAEFAAVWNDSAKMETATSVFLCDGTKYILEGKYDSARDCATFARYLEQYIAVVLKETQALFNWPKIYETYFADMHTLVKFFRRRIPCSCLDKKYQEVKSITKLGHCYNPRCKFPDGMTDRSKTKYCSRCGNATYCSRECQEAHWPNHKPNCDNDAAIKTLFESRQQNLQVWI